MKKAIQHYRSAEEGAMTIYVMFIVLGMMMLGGLGVDVMYNEMTRTKIQNTIDQAVIAAANLQQDQSPQAIVESYMEAAGLEEYPVTVEADLSTYNRDISVKVSSTSKTLFLKTMNIETLPIEVKTQAVEDRKNVEISLVLDISGSMKNFSRLPDMQKASKEFLDLVLHPNLQENTSVTIVPFGGSVNPGKYMFERLGGVYLNPKRLDQRLNGVPDETNNVHLASGEPGGKGLDPTDGIRYAVPNKSTCFDELGNNQTFLFKGIPKVQPIPNPNAPNQLPHFSMWHLLGYYYSKENGYEHEVYDGWCPDEAYSIQYFQNDPVKLKKFIDGLKLFDGTGTDHAMKYAVSFLHPGANKYVREMIRMGEVPAEFSNRPVNYTNDTAKYIILLTDGAATGQVRPKAYMDDKNASIRLSDRKNDRADLYSKDRAIQNLENLCSAAKRPSRNPITVFTIGFHTRSLYNELLSNCASGSSKFYEADGDNLLSVFESIAGVVNKLRLTQ